MDKLEADIRRWDIKLLAVDPIASMTNTEEVNTFADAEVRKVLDPLARVAGSTGCTVVAIMHPPKRTAGLDKMYWVSGSGAYTAVARSVLLIEEGKGNSRSVEVVKASFQKGRPLEFKIEYVPVPGLRRPVPRATWVMSSRVQIRTAICRGNYPTKADIVKMTGLDQKTVEYHVKTLKEEGAIHLGEKRGRADTFGCGPSAVLDSQPAPLESSSPVVYSGDRTPEHEEEELEELMAAGLV
jgi:hypothetical protein